jgi:hypothetical protein
LVKNHTFKEFWQSIDEIETMMRGNSEIMTAQDLQEHIER